MLNQLWAKVAAETLQGLTALVSRGCFLKKIIIIHSDELS